MTLGTTSGDHGAGSVSGFVTPHATLFAELIGAAKVGKRPARWMWIDRVTLTAGDIHGGGIGIVTTVASRIEFL